MSTIRVSITIGKNMHLIVNFKCHALKWKYINTFNVHYSTNDPKINFNDFFNSSIQKTI